MISRKLKYKGQGCLLEILKGILKGGLHLKFNIWGTNDSGFIISELTKLNQAKPYIFWFCKN